MRAVQSYYRLYMHDVCYDMVMVCMALVFWGNLLSFRLQVLDFVSGTSDNLGKAKA